MLIFDKLVVSFNPFTLVPGQFALPFNELVLAKLAFVVRRRTVIYGVRIGIVGIRIDIGGIGIDVERVGIGIGGVRIVRVATDIIGHRVSIGIVHPIVAVETVWRISAWRVHAVG